MANVSIYFPFPALRFYRARYTDHHKHRTIFDKLGVLLELVQLAVSPDLNAEQFVDLFTLPTRARKWGSELPQRGSPKLDGRLNWG